MKQRILSYYLISEVLPPFCLGLLTFTLILLITRLLRMIELVVTRGVPLLQLAKLFSFILPTFLEMTVPMAFLLAILLGFGRLSNDQELIAMKASGISPLQILFPVICIGLLISTLTLLLTLYGRPAANLALKKELFNIAKGRVATALKEKIFNDDFPNILIYVEEIVPPGNTAQGILIVDKRDKVRESIILGKVALINTNEESNTLELRLFDGSIYEREKKHPGFSQTRFNIYDFKLGLDELVGPVREKETGPKEMPIADLLEAIDAKMQLPSRAIPERMELHQRISFGFVPLIFAFLGVSLTLLPRHSRSNRSWGFMLCLFWLMIYYSLLSLGKALGDKNIVHPIPALWLPNFAVGAIGLFFFRKATRESPLYFFSTVERIIAATGRSLRKLTAKRTSK